MINVLLVDDHHLFREGLARIIQDSPGLNLLASLQTGAAAIEFLSENSPDVVIMDVNVPDADGAVTTQQIRKTNPGTQVLILTISEKDDNLFDVIRAGARGYLLKNSSSRELLEAIRRIHAGEAVISPPMAVKLFDEFSNLTAAPQPSKQAVKQNETLTDREREVLRLVARGMSNKEIGTALTISPYTVKAHIGAILEKLQLRGRVEAAAWAIRHGLLRDD